jgi:choline dehydrogenase-like flavoprotein
VVTTPALTDVGDDVNFTANAEEGIGVDWPVRYEDVAPWYDYVERFAGISGSKMA